MTVSDQFSAAGATHLEGSGPLTVEDAQFDALFTADRPVVFAHQHQQLLDPEPSAARLGACPHRPAPLLVAVHQAPDSDLADIQGGTTRECVHLSATAGTVDLILRRYSGLEIRDDVLRLHPSLPLELPQAAFEIFYRGQPIRCRTDPNTSPPSPARALRRLNHRLRRGPDECPRAGRRAHREPGARGTDRPQRPQVRSRVGQLHPMITYRSAARAAGWIAVTTAVGAAGWGIRHALSPSVRRWRAGRGQSRRAGILQVRTFGSGGPVVLLLHGMAAAGNSFGAGFDRLGESARVVVPDLLGFGGSMLPPGPVSGEDHLDALDEMLAALGLSQEPLLVVGHSMGGPLALRFAARHRDQVRTVVTLCAALYRDSAEAGSRIALMGPFEAVLTGDGRLPEVVCAWVCRHRMTAGWVAVAMRPDLPVPVARSAVMHTWDSYRGALDGLLRAPGWEPALDQLAAAGVPVVLVEGGEDQVPVSGRAAGLASAIASVRYVRRREATHLLPLTDGEWCATLIGEHLDGTPAQGRAADRAGVR